MSFRWASLSILPVALGWTAPSSAQLSRCALIRQSDQTYAGECRLNDSSLVGSLRLRPPSDTNKSEWRGEILAGGASRPAVLAVIGTRGELRSAQPWLAVTDFRQHADSMGFLLNIDAFAPGVGTAEDVRILRRVLGYFPDSAAWIRGDSRDCSRGAAPRTLTCALNDASIAEIGEFQPMRPAVQQVRWSVFQLWHNPEYIAHPLTDVNAAPTTTFAQVRALVTDALARLNKGLSARPGEQRTFMYKQTPQGSLELIVDYPADWKPTDKRPAIVFFFGGAWTVGSVEQFSRQAAHFAARGMVAMRPDYRVASRHRTEPDAAVEDGKSAMAWASTHARELGIDPNRVVVAGGSSGGHLAACTIQCPTVGERGDRRVRANALILFNPVLDYPGLANLPDPFSGVFESFPKVKGDAAAQTRISPLAHVARGAPPTLLLFGSNDPLLRAGQVYVDKMKAAGAPVELSIAEGAGHGFFNNSPWYETTLAHADEFLRSLGYISELRDR